MGPKTQLCRKEEGEQEKEKEKGRKEKKEKGGLGPGKGGPSEVNYSASLGPSLSDSFPAADPLHSNIRFYSR